MMENTQQLEIYKKPINYSQIATLWRPIIGEKVTEAQVALCLHQMHLSKLLNNPEDDHHTVAMAESLFAYEAFCNRD